MRYISASTNDDQFSQATWLGGTFDGVAVAMPTYANATTVTATGAWYLLRWQSATTISIGTKLASSSSYTSLATATYTLVSGDVMRLEYVGGVLTGYINGVSKITNTPATPITGQFYSGLALMSTASGVAIFDSWSGGDIAPVTTRVTSTNAISWKVAQRTGTTQAISWGVRSRLNKTSAITWGVRTRVTPATSANTWKVAKRVSATDAITWKVGQRVVASGANTWKVALRTSKTSAITWGVRTRLSKTNLITWGVRSRTSATNSSIWGVRARISKTSLSSWGVRTRVVTTNGITWKVAARSTAFNVQAWKVLSTIPTTRVFSTPQSVSWGVRSRVVAQQYYYNYAVTPEATRYASGNEIGIASGRWGAYTTYSTVTASDGPLASIGTYARGTVIGAHSGLGFHIANNPEAATVALPSLLPVQPGDLVTTSIYIRPSVTSDWVIGTRPVDGTSTWSAVNTTSTPVTIPAGQWTRVTQSYTTPAGSAGVSLYVISSSTLNAGATFDATGLMITKNQIGVPAYADGNTPGWVWTGTANGSSSHSPSQLWGVRSRTNKANAITWGVRARTNKTGAITWNTRKRISTTNQTLWKTKLRIYAYNSTYWAERTQFQFWDGSSKRNVNILGYWDGTQVKSVVVRGWWDGTKCNT